MVKSGGWRVLKNRISIHATVTVGRPLIIGCRAQRGGRISCGGQTPRGNELVLVVRQTVTMGFVLGLAHKRTSPTLVLVMVM